MNIFKKLKKKIVDAPLDSGLVSTYSSESNKD